MNLSARLAELAVAGEILVTSELARDVPVERFCCDPAGRRMLRGFDAPVTVASLART